MDGTLQKLGGKEKDKWQEVDCVVDGRGLSWTSGSVLRDRVAGSQKTVPASDIQAVGYWSEIGVEFGFEVSTTVKGGKVYKFTAAADAERDNWISQIGRLIGSERERATCRRYRVIKTAVLRSELRLDSEQVGTLQRGDVIDVLEAHETVEGGLRTERVRCATGWTSITSRAGNTMLIPDESARAQRSPRAAASSADDVEDPSPGFTLGLPSQRARAAAAGSSLRDVSSMSVVRVRCQANSCLVWFVLWFILMVAMWVNLRCSGMNQDHWHCSRR